MLEVLFCYCCFNDYPGHLTVDTGIVLFLQGRTKGRGLLDESGSLGMQRGD